MRRRGCRTGSQSGEERAMSSHELKTLLDQVADTREVVLRRPPARIADFDLWIDARDDAREAYRRWRAAPDADSYAVYRAAAGPRGRGAGHARPAGDLRGKGLPLQPREVVREPARRELRGREADPLAALRRPPPPCRRSARAPCAEARSRTPPTPARAARGFRAGTPSGRSSTARAGTRAPAPGCRWRDRPTRRPPALRGRGRRAPRGCSAPAPGTCPRTSSRRT